MGSIMITIPLPKIAPHAVRAFPIFGFTRYTQSRAGPTPAFYIHTKIPAASLGAQKSVQSLEVFQDH